MTSFSSPLPQNQVQTPYSSFQRPLSQPLFPAFSLNLGAQAKKTTPPFPEHTLRCLCFPSVGLPSCSHSLHWLKSDPFQVSTQTLSWYSSMINSLLSSLGLLEPAVHTSDACLASSSLTRHCLPKALPHTGLEFIRAGSSPQDVLHQGVQAPRASCSDVLCSAPGNAVLLSHRKLKASGLIARAPAGNREFRMM